MQLLSEMINLIGNLENVLQKEHPFLSKGYLRRAQSQLLKSQKDCADTVLSAFSKIFSYPIFSRRILPIEIYLKNNKDLRISTLIKQNINENQNVKTQDLERLAEHKEDLKFRMDLLRS